MGVLPLGRSANVEGFEFAPGEGGMRGDRDVGSSRRHFVFWGLGDKDVPFPSSRTNCTMCLEFPSYSPYHKPTNPFFNFLIVQTCRFPALARRSRVSPLTRQNKNPNKKNQAIENKYAPARDSCFSLPNPIHPKKKSP